MTTPIRTTHVGSLPRTPALLDANRRHAAGQIDGATFREVLAQEVTAVVTRQLRAGLDIVNDGEYGHFSVDPVDYSAWWTYSFTRLSGISLYDVADLGNAGVREPRSAQGLLTLSAFTDRRDWRAFQEAYADPASGIGLVGGSESVPVVTGPLTYTGADDVARDTRLLTQALATAGADTSRGFVAALSPGSLARLADAHYADDESVLLAAADALRHEYRAITEAGLSVQVDAPDLAECWDQVNPEPTIEQYRAWLVPRIEALNHALEGIDPARVRLHVCWGSWHGPHSTDIGFDDLVDLALAVNADGLSFEAANARHEHEWRLWETTELPEGKYLVPGVVSHATNVVEHPRLVAERIERLARIVGPERVLASTDCGLGGRVHHQIAWSKLEALVQGARLASERL